MAAHETIRDLPDTTLSGDPVRGLPEGAIAYFG